MSLPPALVDRALNALLDAANAAASLRRDRWDFSLEFSQLMTLGATPTALRWLACQGHILAREEVPSESDDCRRFRPHGPLALKPGVCFVLAESGFAMARAPLENCVGYETVNTKNGFVHAVAEPRPRWDALRQELTLGAAVVKQFKLPAPNQETILAVFEEENWPPRIDDPLAPQPEQDSKRRLLDTVKCLNRHQRNPLIRFRGDGTGCGVRWELLGREIGK